MDIMGRTRVAGGLVWMAALQMAVADGVTGQDMREMRVRKGPPATRLIEVLSIGSLDGTEDAFGRIMDAAMDGRGRIFVADDLSHTVKVFGRDGRFIQAVGGEGDGPGELRSPWGVALDAHDSLYVWDSETGRVSVYSPELTFARSIRVSPAWIVTSLVVPVAGKMVMAAFATGDRYPIKIVDGSGSPVQEAGQRIEAPPYLSGFEGSLLGGYLARLGAGYAYTQKSPYAITFFDDTMRALRVCTGDPEWTTAPSDVVRRTGAGSQLEWNKYRHSASLVRLPDDLLLNTILDPQADKRTLQVVNRNCEIIEEIPLSAPVLPMDGRGDRVLAVRSLDYPELVVYRVVNGGGA